ncbi:hypothetical protein LLEC1_02014 [Akanthomyces lecanii]|uniref:Uncharacterized protein n=1 Tax=Cordyceps confragosa TaxID=2714763 RepID=A0A179I3M4_CORDF|nr:hypothetical protein LLEC1_02014 [Akanthomyces lecanii]
MSHYHHRRHSTMDSSTSSRASIASIAHLPRLTETGEINRALPKVPLRVPQKNPRRSLPPVGIPPSGSGPAPYVSPDGSPHPSAAPTPTSPISPPMSPFKTTASETETNELHSPRGSLTPQNMAEAGEPEDEKEWIDHRQRRCRFMILVGVFTAIVAALTIGLAVGLSKSNGKSGSKSSPDGSANAVFPAGSYYVSGAENPFAPDFANLAATMLDADQPTERLTFAFSANKTVVPADAAAPGSRVARCTYTGTVFQATLWTRCRGGKPFEAPSHPSQYAPWPGDFEVSQYKNSTIGDPVCVDQQGKSIADIQAAGGSCLCRYSSTSMS